MCELGGLLAVGVARCSEEPKADVCSDLSVSDVRESLALRSEGEGDSRPNLEGTDEGHGAAGYRAALEMPLESNEEGSGASRTDRPLPLTGDRAKPRRLDSSSRGEP
jgi:hypothetical protein